MTSLIVSGLAQTALGRSLFARDIRDMRASGSGALWELPPLFQWVAKDINNHKYLPFLNNLAPIGAQFVLILKANCRNHADLTIRWRQSRQELFLSFSAALDNGTGAPGMSDHVMISHDISEYVYIYIIRFSDNFYVIYVCIYIYIYVYMYWKTWV